MKKIILMFLVLSFSFQSVWAQESPSFMDKMSGVLRPMVVKVLGEETATRWFGATLFEEIELPEIPEIVRDARSTQKRRALNEHNLTDEVWLRYNRQFVSEVYEVSRRLRPNSNDQAQWMNVLQQGGTHEGVYRGMVLDQTYAGLENYPGNASELLAEFGVDYFKKYLNRTQTKERLLGVNFYSLKRILVENSLEVFEVLASTDSDAVYRWYGHLSGYLARTYPEVFLDDQRANPSMQHHYQWAQAAPEQLIKAETIIKLHLVMNFLQGSN